MQVTDKIHTLRIPFTIPVAPDKTIERHVYVSLVFGKGITLIDSGVNGTHAAIFQYIETQKRKPEEIHTLILSHSHPDHIGSARSIRKRTGCKILAHPLESKWIEDTEKQKHDRPVPGFDMLVEGPVPVDTILEDGQTFHLEENAECLVIHTPGHSQGSVSLFFADEKILFTGDALPLPGDLPLYDNLAESLTSIKKIHALCHNKVNTILSSWEEPVHGKNNIDKRIKAAVSYLEHIHNEVIQAHMEQKETGMKLCQNVVARLGLPPFAANPLVAHAFMSSLPIADKTLSFNP